MKNYPLIPYYKTIKNYPDITIKELIRELNKHDINKNIVIQHLSILFLGL